MADRAAPAGAPVHTEGKAPDHRQLLRRVEQVVAEIQAAEERGTTVHRLAEAVLRRLGDALRISGGRLYARSGDQYEILATFPVALERLIGMRVPANYAAITAMLEAGVVYFEADDPRIDPELERSLGVAGFAAIEVDDEAFLLSFDVAPGTDRDTVLYSLGVLRHAINQRLRQERFEAVFDEARKIQASILPKRVPSYGAFDLSGRTLPMEKVGGDFYDFIPITDKILGLAIADVSGHGLPAALQVRDVYMGLRMGLARDFKIVRTVERMNQIIHKSTLTSRFVSLFYGELELNGVFIYVNAGHPPPFHLSAAGEVRFLEEGGAVLGPIGDATYERGFVRMAPGDLIVLYTDGMIEASPEPPTSPAAIEYGVDRLVELTRRLREKSAREIVDTLLADVEAFCDGAPAQDDRTVVVVRHPG
ncbi:MAG TPA: PP2C family protein-serine/threonine phosphatase [Thermoanaerobaculia bacterium]|nr:PP2C family protein-serine/threonine phosphatase [Thermoanaerobaculia bacterium]